jgi:hypothetical protein
VFADQKDLLDGKGKTNPILTDPLGNCFKVPQEVIIRGSGICFDLTFLAKSKLESK